MSIPQASQNTGISGGNAESADGAYSIAEFSVTFGLGRTSIYREIKAGHLKAVKAGFRTLIRRSDAQAWLTNLPPVRASN